MNGPKIITRPKAISIKFSTLPQRITTLNTSVTPNLSQIVPSYSYTSKFASIRVLKKLLYWLTDRRMNFSLEDAI